ncbi:MAG: hypothetical protein ABSF70_05065 [Terracidiphilus sp.]|jgi:hypothetical protein
MYLSFLSIHRSRSAFRLTALAVVAMAVASITAHAQGTHLWTQSRLEEFQKGTPQGVALTSDGNLREGPGLAELTTTPSIYVWSVAAGRDGASYNGIVGTASPATVLRIGRDGKPFTLFETKDLAVQVVRLGPDGALYAATLPSGKVYRLKPDATAKQDETSAEVVFDAATFDGANAADGKSTSEKVDAKTHYIWDLTFDAAGRLYIATGGPGVIYRVDLKKAGTKPELFFKSDEEHIRSLAWDAKGNLIAGSDGSGLVYRISPNGKGYVLFEAPRREITSIAVGENGTIYAASVGDKSHNPLPPLPVQGAGSMTVTIVQPGSLQAANTSASVPEGSDIYALAEGQAPRKLWSGKDEIVYALATWRNGLIAITGNRGRVFSINDDGSYADIAHLEAQQGLSLARVPSVENAGGFLIGSGNTGKVYTLVNATGKHEYASDVLDTGALARFGRVEVEPGSANYDLLTRTGNVEQPVRGWSEWLPLRDGVVASPAGRYLQWKAVLRTNGTVGGVGVNYLPVNAAPVVDDVVVVPGARFNAQGQVTGQPPTINIVLPSASQSAAVSFDSGSSAPLQAAKDRAAVTVRWAAHDDNGDDLTFSLFMRGDGESVWRLLKDNLTDKAYSFDAALIPDGGYQIKVVASDAPSHTPADALTGEKVSERFEVDTTPPVVTALHAVEVECRHAPCAQQFHVTFDAEDAASPIAHAEYSLDAGAWQYVEPVGGLSDSKREHYDVLISVASKDATVGEHLITVRVYDRHDNIGVAKTVIPAHLSE